jgi:hypothetical protein
MAPHGSQNPGIHAARAPISSHASSAALVAADSSSGPDLQLAAPASTVGSLADDEVYPWRFAISPFNTTKRGASKSAGARPEEKEN